MKNLFLGIDVGTTAIKFGVIEQGKLLFKTSVPVTTYYEDKQKYQKAEEILAGIVDGVRVIPHSLRKELQYIGFSTAMHSCLPVVEETYDRIFIWSDNQGRKRLKPFEKHRKPNVFIKRLERRFMQCHHLRKFCIFKKQESIHLKQFITV